MAFTLDIPDKEEVKKLLEEEMQFEPMEVEGVSESSVEKGNEILALDMTSAEGLMDIRKAMEAFASGETSYVDEDAEDGMLYMTGFGWGHSVGMPQVSAKNMALAGRTYEEILKYYYTGIEIRSLHGE